MKQIIRRSIERKLAEGGSGFSRAAAAARAGEDMYVSLARWIGTDGCHALFGRARAEAEGSNGALASLKLRTRAVPYIDGIADVAEKYGDAETAEAIESMLVGVSELLGRLIGVDMSNNLIKQSLPDSSRVGGSEPIRGAKG